jgi:hypothetical protein
MKIDFKAINRKQQALFGIVTVLCGFAMMWASTVGKQTGGATVAKALSEAIDIDPLLPSVKNNGSLVVAAGRLSSGQEIEDEFLKPAKHLILIRHVEMYQWTEHLQQDNGGTPEYSIRWAEGQVDFLSFVETAGHENPLLKYLSKKWVVESCSFGGFDGRKILKAIEVVPPLELKREYLKDSNLTIENNRIVVPREPGGASAALGDMRISYQSLPSGDYTVAGRQADEMTLLGDSPSDAVIVAPGISNAATLFEEVGAQSASAYSGLMLLGAFIMFLGMNSILFKLMPNLDLRPRMELHGPMAIVVVSAAVSGVAMVVVYILGML